MKHSLKRALALALSFAMLFSMTGVSTIFALAQTPENSEIISIAPLEEAIARLNIPQGMAKEDLPLPETLTAGLAVHDSGDSRIVIQYLTVPLFVTWDCVDYDPAAPVGTTFTFTPQWDRVASPLAQGVTAPTITVTLTEKPLPMTLGLGANPKITVPLNFTNILGDFNCTNYVNDTTKVEHTHPAPYCFAWDNGTGTLTLNNLELETAGPNSLSPGDAIMLPGDSKVVMEGNSSVTSRYTGEYNSTAISASGKVTFGGTGTLTATGGPAGGMFSNSYGVSASGNFILTSGTLNAIGGNLTSVAESSGVWSEGILTVTGGTLNATGGTTTGSSYGVHVKTDLELNGGTLNATGGAGDLFSYGVCASTGNIELGTGEITAKAAAGETNKQPFNKAPTSTGNMRLVGVTQWNNKTGDPCTYRSPSANLITVPLDFTGVSGDFNCTSYINGTIKVEHTHPAPYCFAWDNGTDTLTLNNLELETDATTTVSLLVPNNAKVVMEGSSTVTNGYTGTVNGSIAIYCGNNPTFRGTGSLTATGGNPGGGQISAGIRITDENMTLNSGTLTAIGGNTTVGSMSYGVFAANNGGKMRLNGGKLTAKAAPGGKPLYQKPTLSGGMALVTAADWNNKTGDPCTYQAPDTTDTKITVPLNFNGRSYDYNCTNYHNNSSFQVNHVHSDNVYCFEWKNESKTLTLNNLNLEADGAAYSLSLPGGTKVNLLGSSTITNSSTETGTSWAIRCTSGGDLTLSGTGSLTTTGGNQTDNGKSYGIYSYADTLILESGTLTATGGTVGAGGESCGIYSDAGSVTLKDGTLTAIGGMVGAGGESCGIYSDAGSVTLKDGTLTATGGTVGAGGKSCGIYSHFGSVTLEDGTLTATGGMGGDKSYGIFADGAINLNGGKVTAKSLDTGVDKQPFNKAPTLTGGMGFIGTTRWNDQTGAACTYEVGGSVGDNPKITDYLTFTATTADTNCATYTNGPVGSATIGHTHTDGKYCFQWTMESKTLTLNSLFLEADAYDAISLPADGVLVMEGTSTVKNTRDGGSAGIYGAGSLTLRGSGALTVTTADTTAYGNTTGIRAGSVTLESGTLTVAPGSAGGTSESCGIFTRDAGFTQTGGTLTTTGGASNSNSYGIDTNTGDFKLTGGTLTATGGTLNTTGGAANESSGVSVGRGSFTQTGGTLTATGGTAPKSYGVSAKGLTLSGGKITAKAAAGKVNTQPFNKAPTLQGGMALVGTATWDNKTGDPCTYADSGAPTNPKITIPLIFDVTTPDTNCATYTSGSAPIGHTHSNGKYCFQWTKESKTLTLNSLFLEVDAYDAISLPAGVVLVMEGTSTVKSTKDGDITGILADGSLTLRGGGALTVTTGDTTAGITSGIQAGSVTLESGTLTVAPGSAGGTSESRGIFTRDAGFTQTGGTLTTTGGAGDSNSYGINTNGKGFKLTGGTLTATGGPLNATGSAADESSGVRTGAGSFTQTGGTLTATGGTAPKSYGVSVGGYNFTLSGGTLTAKAAPGGQPCSIEPILKDGMALTSAATWDNTTGAACTYQVPGAVAIDEANFPDDNFRAWLLDGANLDGKGADGILTPPELASITSMNVSAKQIKSLVGIQHFTGLQTLGCNDNRLTTLDVSALTGLTYLDCQYNRLTALDVGGLTKLETLYCNGNRLTTLDMGGLTALTDLDCKSNRLTTLDMSSLTALSDLQCGSNLLTTLDLRPLTALTNLSCANNLLTTLNLRSLTALTSLTCSGNRLTTLDVTGLPLTYLNCRYNYMTGEGDVKGFTGSWGTPGGSGSQFSPQLPAGFIQAMRYHDLPEVATVGQLTLTATVLPANATNKTIIWEINSNDNGETNPTLQGNLLTTTAPGRVVLSGTIPDGTVPGDDIVFGFSVTVVAEGHATGVRLDKTSLTLAPGGGESLAPTVSPADATDKTLRFVSSDPTVATVDQNGRVTAVANGTAFITAITTDGGWTGDCVVTVATGGSTNPGGGDGDSSSGTGSGTGTGSGDPAQPTPPATGTVQTPATVDKNGNATTTVPEQTITDAIRSAKAAGQSGRTSGIAVLLDVTGGKGASSIATTLSKASLDALIAAGVTEVTVQSDVATITLDLATLKAIRATADGDVVISAQPVKPGTLPPGGQAAIGSRPVFNFSITAGGKPVTGFGGGTVSLAIPYTPAAGENTAGLYGVYVSETGNTIYLTNSAYDASVKCLRMSATHFSVFGVGYKAPATFADTKTHFAKADIEFVAARGLLTGTAGSFSPNAPLTRANLVTALGQLTGVNGSSYKTTPFTDVPATASYAPYAAWAVEKGILTGADANTFAPDKPITRQELAVYLQNYAKAVGYPLPRTREAIVFADSTAIAPTARDAVKALQMAGVMNGKNDNKFDPAAPATRGELASILHRFIELRMDPKTAQGFDVNDSGTTLLYENGRLVKSTERVVGASTYTFNQFGEAAIAQKKSGSYTVVKGDSFWAIAQKLGCTMADLEALNGKTRYDNLYVGEVLRAPQR